MYLDSPFGIIRPKKPSPLAIIKSKGFFEVLTPGGIAYTKKGNFTLDKDGFLMTDRGHFVLSSIPADSLKGENAQVPQPLERKIQIQGKKFNVNLSGQIDTATNAGQSLSIVEFKDTHTLKKLGSLNYLNADTNNIKQANNSKVYQGFLEQSNVNAISEMSALIKANRHFESLQRVIKAYDSISSKGINEISKF